MKDDKGLYYHPDPTDHDTRVYVRQGLSGPEFRLWRAAYPEVWEKHQWLDRAVIEAAAGMYKERGNSSDPMALYDLNVARALIKEDERKRGG
ncbi:hypothetical protein LJC15_03070 [Desulfovibrio sp. OttesenSCG-928-G11]|nr:hypothetical protein [Desulfovibrio sp. OttesenSCG-928-G11]